MATAAMNDWSWWTSRFTSECWNSQMHCLRWSTFLRWRVTFASKQFSGESTCQWCRAGLPKKWGEAPTSDGGSTLPTLPLPWPPSSQWERGILVWCFCLPSLPLRWRRGGIPAVAEVVGAHSCFASGDETERAAPAVVSEFRSKVTGPTTLVLPL